MSLTSEDLQAIRQIVEETVDPIKGDLEALTDDIKEIYEMISGLQKVSQNRNTFSKSSIEEKLLELHSDIMEAARQAGVNLPSH